MYLNLDLLYNIDKYIYPLFYYEHKYGYGREVHSPMVFKSVIFSLLENYFYVRDYKNSNSLCSRWNYKYIEKFPAYECTFTENETYHAKRVYMEKCKPFKLNPEKLYFLKNNTRINKK